MKRREFIQAGIAVTALTGCASGRFTHRYSEPKKVYEPITIGTITIPNRIVFPPITTNYGDSEGFVTQRLIDYHRHIALGGAGLSIIGATPVRKDWRIVPNAQCLDDDKYIEGFKKLIDTIKQNGSIACVQLVDGGDQISSSVQEIKELIGCFSEAAYRAKLAGADMIEMHGAHGYLISRFLSPRLNQRNDMYGGSTKNRTRFLREIMEETRKKVGDSYPISCRISAVDFVEGGSTIEDSQEIAQILVDSSVDVIDVSVIGGGIIPTKEQGRRCYAYIARGIKNAVDVPVIGVGNILDLVDAEIILQDGDADMAAMGRALVADPYLISKTRQGKVEEINYCIQCRNCIKSFNTPEGMSCSVNKNI
ncbi:NADH:flavin oxidoreductase [Candidatus Latescibacterota bacterium]